MSKLTYKEGRMKKKKKRRRRWPFIYLGNGARERGSKCRLLCPLGCGHVMSSEISVMDGSSGRSAPLTVS